jgi:hypothetical protein
MGAVLVLANFHICTIEDLHYVALAFVHLLLVEGTLANQNADLGLVADRFQLEMGLRGCHRLQLNYKR